MQMVDANLEGTNFESADLRGAHYNGQVLGMSIGSIGGARELHSHVPGRPASTMATPVPPRIASFSVPCSLSPYLHSAAHTLTLNLLSSGLCEASQTQKCQGMEWPHTHTQSCDVLGGHASWGLGPYSGLVRRPVCPSPCRMCLWCHVSCVPCQVGAVDWTGKDMRGAQLQGCDLQGCLLRNTNLWCGPPAAPAMMSC